METNKIALIIGAFIVLSAVTGYTGSLYSEKQELEKQLASTHKTLAICQEDGEKVKEELKATKTSLSEMTAVAGYGADLSDTLMTVLEEYEDSTVDTIDWFYENCWFKNGQEETAEALYGLHFDITTELAERISKLMPN